MANVTFIDHDGTSYEVAITAGRSFMELARDAGLTGIKAECGGACACSTCHVYVDPAWIDRLPAKGPMENDMLDFAIDSDPQFSRLSCQIEASDALDGLVLRFPREQA